MGCQRPLAHTQQKLTQVPSPPPLRVYWSHTTWAYWVKFHKPFILGYTVHVQSCIDFFFSFIPLSLAKSQHYSDGLIEIFTQYGDHLYR